VGTGIVIEGTVGVLELEFMILRKTVSKTWQK
jgi:hypothetical protein